jgi:hypothetical protein
MEEVEVKCGLNGVLQNDNIFLVLSASSPPSNLPLKVPGSRFPRGSMILKKSGKDKLRLQNATFVKKKKKKK